MNNFQVGSLSLTGNPLVFAHALLQEMEEGVATLNSKNRITYCNPAFERLVRRPAGEINGSLLTDLFPDALPEPGHRQQVAGSYDSLLSLHVIPVPADGEQSAGEKMVMLKKSHYSGSGQLAPQLAEKVINAAPGLVAVYHIPSGRWIYINHTAEQTLGYLPAQWNAGGPDFASGLIHPDDAGKVTAGARELLQQLHAGNIPPDINTERLPDFRIRHKNGGWKWLRTGSVLSERDAAGELLQIAVQLTDVTGWKSSGEKMVRNEVMLAEAQSAAGFGLWEYYVADSRMEWSDEMYRIYGYQPGEVEVNLQLYASVLHPDDRERFRQEVEQIISDHRPYTTQRRVFRPDGTMRYLVSRTDLVKDEAGSLLKVIGFTVDITDLKQARQELNEKQHFIGRITETIPDILYIYDIQEQRNVYANRRLPEILGYSVEEVQQMGDRFLPLFAHADDFPRLLGAMERLAAASDTDIVEVEYRILDPQGNWHWFYDRATVFSRDPDGSVRQVLGSSQDVTERRLAQEKLAESEYFIKQVADSSPDGLYVYDLQLGQPVYNNRQIYQKLGYTEEEFYAMGVKTTKIITHPEDLPRRSEHFDKLRQLSNDEVAEIEYRVQTTAGDWLWVRSRDSVFKRTAAGKPWQVLGIVQDITERKKGAEELRYKDHLISMMLSSFPLILSRISREGLLLEATGSGLRNLGLSASRLAGLDVCEAYPHIAPYLREVIKGNKATFLSEMETEGDKKYFQNYFFYDQKQECAVGFSVDVTEQKEAEEKLAESRRFIEQITNAIPQIIYVYDLTEKRNIYINREIFTSLGYSPGEIAAMGSRVLEELRLPEEREMMERHLAQVAAMPDKVHELEYRLKDARGNWRWLLARETVFRSDDRGVPLQITGVSQDITERKKAEEEIRFKNKIIEGILSNLPVILSRIDGEGVIRESVGAGLRQVGRQDGEIVGENVFTGSQYASISGYIRKVLQGESLTFVGQPVYDGKSFYFLNYYYFDSAQRMAVGFSLDITQQKETEEKLKRSEEQLRELNAGLERRVQERTAELTASEERYRAFVQQSSEAIWRFEFDGIESLSTTLPEDEQTELIYRHMYLAECNDTMAQLYGYDNARQLIGSRFEDLAPRTEPANLEYLRSFIRSGYRLANGESVEADRNGNLKYFINNLTGITRNGSLIRMWGTQRDITDRKRAEEALREKEQEYGSLVTATSQMIWYTSPEGLIVEDIPLWRLYTGQSPEQVLGYGWAQALHPHDRDRAEYIWKRAVESSQIYETEYRLRGRSGEYRWFFARGVPIFDPTGTIKKWIGVSNDIHGRKLAEEALRISEERLELAVQAANIGIFDWSVADGRVIWTEQEERLFGLEPGTFDGTLESWASFVLPEDLPEVWYQAQSRMDRRDAELYLQYRIRRADGEIRWLEASGKFIYGEDGMPLRAVGINTDITYRKLAEQALRESESRFRRLFESDMIGILFSDSTGTITDANSAFLQLLGYSRDDLHAGSLRWHDLTPAEYATLDQTAATELISKGFIAPYEKEYIRKDGSRVAVLIGATLLKEPAPGIAVGFVLDISDRKKSQERLHLSEERFRLVAEATNEGIWDWDIQLDRVWRNEGYYKLFGHQSGEAASDLEGWKQRLHPEDAARVKRGVEEALGSDRENWSDEYRIQRSDESYAYIMDRAYILRDKQGQPLRMIGSKIDLTQLKETQSALEQQAIELKQSNADLEQFAYISSHDLQEPLNTAASFAKLLKRRYENQLDNDANEFINFITDATERMKRIIRSLLEYSRITSDGRQPTEVPLDQVLDEARQNLQQRILESGADIRAGAMPVVRAHATQMLQLFQNLIANAIKFRSSQPPVIEVYAEEQPGNWLFSISDNGIGMDMKHAEKKIFQVFQRLHARDEYEGTGIGLAICKKIVERHGGAIWADSQPGKGTIFYFTLKK